MAMNNSLVEVHPELVSEWSEKNLPLTPDDITFGSNKKVWWKIFMILVVLDCIKFKLFVLLLCHMRSSFSMPLLYHAYVYLEFLILACTIYILALGEQDAKQQYC